MSKKKKKNLLFVVSWGEKKSCDISSNDLSLKVHLK